LLSSFQPIVEYRLVTVRTLRSSRLNRNGVSDEGAGPEKTIDGSGLDDADQHSTDSAAMWLAQSFLHILSSVDMDKGYGLWVGLSALSGLMTNFMSDAGTTALLGPIVIPMGIMTGVEGEPWAVGLGVAFATSFAHFLIVGTPNNAIVYGLGTYPDSGEKMIHPLDFIKYGFVLFLLSMAVLWVVEFLVVYNIVGFPEGVLETAKSAMDAGMK